MTEAKPKRRWFRFGLRTFFASILVISVPLGWLAWSRHQVFERARVLRLADNVQDLSGPFKSDLPWRLKLFGAKPVGKIYVGEKTPEEIYSQIEAAYPEASVRRSDLKKEFPNQSMPTELWKALKKLF
jgi:hypothetical protein